MWQWYLHSLASRPILTKTATTLGIMASGDLICQKIEDRDRVDLARTARVTSVGLIAGPLYHHWYNLLEKRLPGATLSRVCTKMLVDQSVMAPTIVSIFFFMVGILEGRPLGDVVAKYKRDFIDTMKGNYVLWPAANLINFKFVPLDLRILYINCVSLIWNIFISHQQHKDQ